MRRSMRRSISSRRSARCAAPAPPSSPGFELPEALLRLGAGLAELKRAAAVYGLEIDAMLDSVRISAPSAPGADPQRRLLEVAFTAFGADHRIPLLMERRAGRWLPLTGDGPPAAGLPVKDQSF